MKSNTPPCLQEDQRLREALKGKQGYGKGMQTKRRRDRAIGILIHGNSSAAKMQETAFRAMRRRDTKPIVLLDTEFGFCGAAELRHRNDPALGKST